LSVDYFSSNGRQCLNCLSHLRGPPQDATDDPLGENLFPREHPAYKVFARATWDAKEEIGRIQSRYLTASCQTEDEFLNLQMQYRSSYFEAIARCALRAVGDEHTGRWYEELLRGNARSLLTEAVSKLSTKNPSSGLGQFQGFTGQQVLDFRDRLTIGLRRISSFYKTQAAARVRLVQEFEAQSLTADQTERITQADGELRKFLFDRAAQRFESDSARTAEQNPATDVGNLERALLRCAYETLTTMAGRLCETKSQDSVKDHLREDAELVFRWLISRVSPEDTALMDLDAFHENIKALAVELAAKPPEAQIVPPQLEMEKAFGR
jgi:hypothetical protein